MYLKQSKYKKTGRTYLSIVRGYWDSDCKQSRTKTIKTLGYLDELEKEYPDPIAHFEQVVVDMNQAEAEENQPIAITINLSEKIKEGSRRMRYGYAPLSRIYHDLAIHSFVNSRARSLNVKYIPNNILKLLCFERLLAPGSKKKAHENKNRYFENTDFSLDDVYGFLSLLIKYKDDLQVHLHQRIKTLYERATELVYYDVTNYYFEIDEEDELKKRGVSKEHRPDPIIQMGLFMDAMGIPISYQLFPGNTNDCETVRPMLAKLKRDYEIGRVIIVADKGNNTAKNVNYHVMRGDGYVYSQTIRGGQKELKDYVFDEDGYTWIGDDYKIKSRIYPREISVIGNNGKQAKKRIAEKQILFYSRDYDRRAKAEREPALKKAMELVNNPAKYNKATSYGAAKYVKNLEYDKETGEILTLKKMPIFDEEKLREEERFDGYYAIVTSELDKSDQEIIEIYRGLWRIEESFKVTKSDLKTRPVFLSRQDRIESHFLICFIALTIIRILQHKLKGKYSANQILDSLRNMECTNVEENIYIFDYEDNVIRDLGACLGIDFSRKYMTFGEIKKSLADVKKSL
ncbi:MAG: IS1634 family transposase [Eubacteriales bacterium]|nr:IS1634 family transposase [Eubacteriales bacterium]